MVQCFLPMGSDSRDRLRSIISTASPAFPEVPLPPTCGEWAIQLRERNIKQGRGPIQSFNTWKRPIHWAAIPGHMEVTSPLITPLPCPYLRVQVAAVRIHNPMAESILSTGLIIKPGLNLRIPCLPPGSQLRQRVRPSRATRGAKPTTPAIT